MAVWKFSDYSDGESARFSAQVIDLQFIHLRIPAALDCQERQVSQSQQRNQGKPTETRDILFSERDRLSRFPVLKQSKTRSNDMRLGNRLYFGQDRLEGKGFSKSPGC